MLFRSHYLETTLPRFSEPLSSHCRRDNDKPITTPMTQWREQFKKKRTVDPLFPTSNPAPLVPHEPLRPPTQFHLPTLQSTHFPSWPDAQTPFPLVDQTPFPRENDTEETLRQLKGVGLELTDEELRQWALDALLSPEDWKWLWEPVPVPIPSTYPTLPLLHPPQYDVSNASLRSTFAPNAPSTYVHSAEWPLQDTLSAPAPCVPAPSAGNSVMWAPVAQPQPQLVHPLPEWLTEEVFESGSRSNDGGNVTVEEPPIPFSPFSLADCTMLNHFSFNDFIAIAFPDIAGDLDTQI